VAAGEVDGVDLESLAVLFRDRLQRGGDVLALALVEGRRDPKPDLFGRAGQGSLRSHGAGTSRPMRPRLVVLDESQAPHQCASAPPTAHSDVLRVVECVVVPWGYLYAPRCILGGMAETRRPRNHADSGAFMYLGVPRCRCARGELNPHALAGTRT